MRIMIRVKEYKKRKKVGIHIVILSFLLIFITVFGVTLSKSFTSFIEADTNGAIRGQPYDLWADKEVGKRDFTEIAPRKVVPDKVSSPGGVIVDRSVSPGRAYIWDSGNSRIVGIDLSHCYALDPNQRCSADIVIGQPSATDYGACNGDSSFQYYPNRSPSSASTLCGVAEWTHTTLEDKSFTSMYVDTNGDLYVADVLNNRVLKYISPFTTDQIADEVWGQPDFTHNQCNLTRNYTDSSTPLPTASSLCFATINGYGAGVSLDTQGNLWVADGGNNRVLRYPNNGGVVAKTADIVIGQPNFTSGGDYSGGSGLARLASPTSVRFDNDNNLYVADTGNSRVLKYAPPFSTSMNAAVLINSATLTGGLDSIELTPAIDGLWTYENEGPGAGFRKWDLNGNYQNIHFTNWNPGGGSIGIDNLGNILVSAYVYQQDVARFSFDSGSNTYVADQSLFSPPGGYNLTAADRFEQGGWGGVAVTNNQLIVTDSRLMYWNNPMNVTNGQAPDGYVFGSSPTDTTPGFTILKADSDGRIYVARGTSIYIYQAPLTNSSAPIKILVPPFDVTGGGTINILNTIGGLAVSPHGEYLWVSNPDDSRVFRINNPLNAFEVDVVLGQTSLSGTLCNRGLVPPPNVDGSISADLTMLCIPGALSLDIHQNLFVSDHFFESAGNDRLLMYSQNSFPSSPVETAVFNISATKEFPRVNTVTNFAAATFETAFDSHNRMVVGYNPYFGPRFIEYYNNPTAFNPSNRSDSTYAVADGRFKDFYGWAFGMTFDSNNNLFVYDVNRGKVLIYKDPFGTPPADNGGGGGGGNTGGGGSNNTGGSNSGGNNNYYYATTSSTTQSSGAAKPPTAPVSYIQVSEQTPASYSQAGSQSSDTTGQAITSLVNNTETNKTFSLIMGVLTEVAKNSNPQFSLNFAGFSLLVFLFLLELALALSGGSVFDVLPLVINSLLNKSKRYGGIVYNSNTGRAVAFAKVSILRKEATTENSIAAIVVESSITDLEGRYSLNVLPSKNLSIQVKALGYSTFLKTLPSNFDVGLSPIKEDSIFKRILGVDKIKLFKTFRLIGLLSAIWGYYVTIYAQVAHPAMANLILLAIYSVMFILATYPSLYSLFLKKVYITDSDNKKVGSAIVRIFQDKNLIDLGLTSKNGVVKFNLEEGIYKAVTTKKGYGYSEVEVEIGEEGKIKNKIIISKSNQAENLTSDLDLHDQVIQNNHDKFNLH